MENNQINFVKKKDYADFENFEKFDKVITSNRESDVAKQKLAEEKEEQVSFSDPDKVFYMSNIDRKNGDDGNLDDEIIDKIELGVIAEENP